MRPSHGALFATQGEETATNPRIATPLATALLRAQAALNAMIPSSFAPTDWPPRARVAGVSPDGSCSHESTVRCSLTGSNATGFRRDGAEPGSSKAPPLGL
jgi:hypothetical protein